MMDEDFSNGLRNAKSVEEFLEIIDKADDEKPDIDERLEDTGAKEDSKVKILAVTSCPTGIAHTYMAAEGLMIILACVTVYKYIVDKKKNSNYNNMYM